jgi:hypothetical protein
MNEFIFRDNLFLLKILDDIYIYIKAIVVLSLYQPGKAIKASECLAISAFLWCISATAFTSPTVSPVICTTCSALVNIKQILKTESYLKRSNDEWQRWWGQTTVIKQ